MDEAELTARAATDADEPFGAAWLHATMMEVARRRGDHDEATKWFEALPEDPMRVPHINDLYAGWLAIPMGWHLLQSGNLARAADRMISAADVMRRHDNFYGVGVALVGIGAVRHAQGELDSAADTLRQALDVFDDLPAGTAPAIGRAMTLTGAVYRDFGHLDEAEDVLVRSVSAYEVTGDRIAAVDTLSQLAETHYDLGRALDAAATWKQALTWVTETNHANTAVIETQLSRCRAEIE